MSFPVVDGLIKAGLDSFTAQQEDMILRYEDVPLYSSRDLRSATIQGERDELVTLTIQRGDSQVTVSTQRGPLGVRLNPMSINPEQNQ
jgi:hypothetical protein